MCLIDGGSRGAKLSVNIIAASFLSIWGEGIGKFKNYIRMSVSLLLLNLPPLKFPYGVRLGRIFSGNTQPPEFQRAE